MKKLLFLAMMLLMGITAKATVTLVSADMTNLVWTVSDTQGNLQYVLEARNGDPSNGFKLTLSQLDPQGGTPYVSNDLLNDQYFWETYFWTLTEQEFGTGYTLSENLKELVVNNVTLQSGLFNSYSELRKLTLTYDNDANVPDNCFGGCEKLWKEGIYVNFEGTNFTLGKSAFNYNNQFPLYTNSYTVKNAFDNACYNFDFYYTGPRITVTADRTNMVWTGVSEADYVQYELGAIEGNPSNGFYLILSPYNNSKGYISTDFVGDGNFWEPYFAAESFAVSGTAYQAANCIKQLTFNNVAISGEVTNLFASYAEIDSMLINLDNNWNEYWIPEGTFSGCTSLEKVTINFAGSNFWTNTNCLNNTASYTIYTNSAVAENELNNYKNNNSSAYTVVCTASHVIIDSSQASNMIWTGSDVDSNVQFEVGAINGSPSNGFYMTLSRLDATKPASVTNALRNDPNFWESFFYNTSYQVSGEYHSIQESLKKLTITDVDMAQDLFQYYNVIRELTLNYSYDTTIPGSCFSESYELDTVFVNFTGSNLGIDSWAFNTYNNYVVKTASFAAKRAFSQYKNNYSAQYTIMYTGQVPMSNYYLIIDGLTSSEQEQWRFALSEDNENEYVIDLETNNLTFPTNTTFYVGTLDGSISLGTYNQNYAPDSGWGLDLVTLEDGKSYPFLSPNFLVGRITFRDGGNWQNIQFDQKRCAKPTVTYSDGKLHFACDTPGVTYRYDVSYGNGGETNETEVTLDSYTISVNVYAYMQDGSLAGSEDTQEQFTITPTSGQGSGQSGDLNGDGVLSVADITMLANMVVGKTPAASDPHEYVDLGLPSGTLWATCNIGATNPEDYGDYFAWGETTTKSDYSWGTYFDTKDGGSTFAKYTNNGDQLLAEDDAATANWGSNWCTPSKDQFDELLNNTASTWTTLSGVYGRLLTSTVAGYNDKSIFIPAAGNYGGSSLRYPGSYGYVWSRTLSSNTTLAYYLTFYSGNMWVNTMDNRSYGMPIRPVRVAQQSNP